jgi:anti-sigma28 factor (negative regulator of flagellin synthesis)
MVGVKGVGGIPEPTPERPANVRERRREDVKSSATQDGVQISSEAQEASAVARLVQLAKQEAEIRPDKVASAKEAIERGDYKIPEVIAEVAKRLSRYLP